MQNKRMIKETRHYILKEVKTKNDKWYEIYKKRPLVFGGKFINAHLSLDKAGALLRRYEKHGGQ